MNKTLTQKESWQGLDLTYSFELQNEGVSQVNVEGVKNMDGASLQIARRYWRDMSFAPTQNEQVLSSEENEHIAQEVRKIWFMYPDIEPVDLMEDEASATSEDAEGDFADIMTDEPSETEE